MGAPNIKLFPPAGVADPAELAFRHMIGDAPVPIAALDLNLELCVLSQGWRDQAVSPDIGQASFFDAFEGSALRDAASACLDGQTRTLRAALISRAGEARRWFHFDLSPWPRQGAPFRLVVLSGREITEAVRVQEEVEAARRSLAEQNARFEAALSAMPHGLSLFDKDQRLVLCNTAYRDLYKLPETMTAPGASLDDILAYRLRVGTAPKSLTAFRAAAVEAEVVGGAVRRDVELADGRTLRLSHNKVEGGGFVVTHEDVTDLLHAAAQAEFLAFRDPLTSLPNRAAFQRAYDEAVVAAERDGEMFGLIMVDVDHFKDINDTLGHDAGDALLQSLSDLLKRSFRSTDTVARLGGDEFAIVLRGLRNEADLTRPIDVLQSLLRTPIEHAGQSFTICASIGAAVYDDPDADPSHLLKNADVALYQAKYDGRNRSVVFKPSMRTEVEKRVELLREVRLGISQGEFDLHYQPVVDLPTHTVAGFEALMRWNHPEQGILTPAAFMAAFEDNDLSLQLGEVAFERALAQMRAWMDDEVAFGRVAINVSSSQFRTGRLAAEIYERLERWRVPADRLTIEVTENVYMGWGSDVVSDTVRQLHDAGVLIALDDFGTGYASLANLRQFPIDRLKIDKSFVQDTEDDAIVRAVINLGSSMGMKVVAEGVERADQLNTLTGYGCDQVQGYHFAKPMPGSAVAGFLQTFEHGD
ncbi:MAG TPA: EAL domain-containing protein [Caulobacter sp.]|nr:EAL domain-containing protein [Caulobacter sp.]